MPLSMKNGIVRCAMLNFAMLRKIPTETFSSPKSIRDLNQKVRERIRNECPEVQWVESYALLGSSRPMFLCEESEKEPRFCVYDYLDVFDAPDTTSASRVASIVRSLGHSMAKTWISTDSEGYRKLEEKLVGELVG
ncbi:hypothetical protein ACFLQ0_05165 [Nitrospinota bacterium]